MADVDVSVIIPVYGSESSLRPLAARLLLVLEETGRSHEIIFVEDGGADGSWRILCELQARHPDRITAIQLMRNYGQHNALMCGFHQARGEFIVTMDDDLQNPPEEVPKLVEKLCSGDFDLIYGRYEFKKHSGWRNAGSLLVNTFYRTIFGNPIQVCSFRAIRRPLLATILSYDLNFTFVDGLLAWNTQRIGQVEVEHLPRSTGRSGYDLKKLVLLALNLFTNFSLLPLQIVSGCGFVVSAVGFLLALYYLIQSLLSNIVVPGYASIIIAVLIIGGTQLLALGIIGEYLGRLHLNVNRKPQYQIRKLVGLAFLDADPNRNRQNQRLRPVSQGRRFDEPDASKDGAKSASEHSYS
jgi:undecaprenyl-phosphate 4-deoxy-4-formamido-L-arabinose transferase